MKKLEYWNVIPSALLSFSLLTAAQSASAVVSNQPLFLTDGVAPNLLFTLDDSGSMAWAYTPDTIWNTATTINNAASTVRFFSATFNSSAYNPSITYTPPVIERFNSVTGQITTTSYTTSFTNAWINGFNPNNGSIDLSRGYRPTYKFYPTSVSVSYLQNPDHHIASHPTRPFQTGRPAYYSVFTPGPGCNINNAANVNNNDNCYSVVNVGTAERQNFANWYSFYRTRSLATATAATLAFNQLPNNIRVSWQMLTHCPSIGVGGTCNGGSGRAYNNQLNIFSGQHRATFFAWLADIQADQSTPLRGALDRAGRYLSQFGGTVNSPYARTPGVDATELACRPTYHLLMTDGVWNGDGTSTFGNSDNTSVTLPDGRSYTPIAPYRDATTDTLADIAFRYWSQDARTNLPNQLKPFAANSNGYWDAQNNPATWQHMVNFTVGVGLTRSLTNPQWGGSTFTGGYSNFVNGANWPPAASDSNNNAYDLWHAAINSRGEFFSVDAPDQLVNAFNTILNRIAARDPSAAAVSLDSDVTTASNTAYYTRFSSTNWTGELAAYSVGQNGQLTSLWNARDNLTSAAGRTIRINRNGSLVDFTMSNLSTTNQAALNRSAAGVSDGLGAARVSYLKGATDSRFRTRAFLLGDIIHSSPVVVSQPNRLASLMDKAEFGATVPSGQSYANFQSTQASRAKRIYVGANDGMLHAFDANGQETFAFIPTAVIPNLNRLTDPNYTGAAHRFYVDGTPVVGDVYYDNAWHTILVGTLRGGGRSIFALDVTDPSNIKLLWEFSSTDDPDMGFSFGRPIITKLHNGDWGVIMSNGYDSSGGTGNVARAALFVLNAKTGARLAKLTVGTSVNTTNGLGTPKAADINGDLITDFVYAGDLRGNLWRFDLTGSNLTDSISANGFSVAFGGSPLFTATNNNTAQPITSAPNLTRHPSGTGYIVSFGTGKYIEDSDAAADTTKTMSLYGIWDRQTNGSATSTPSISRSNLVAQTFFNATTSSFSDDGGAAKTWDVRQVSRNPIQWYLNNDPTQGVNRYGWYLDLRNGNTRQGEMVVTDPTSRANLLFAATIIPSNDPCQPGIDRWFLSLDATTGGAAIFPTLDLTGNRIVDLSDNLNSKPVSGVRIPGFGTPTIVGGRSFYNDDSGVKSIDLDFGPMAKGRQNWRQVGE